MTSRPRAIRRRLFALGMTASGIDQCRSRSGTMRGWLHVAAALIVALWGGARVEALTIYRFGGEELPPPEARHELVQIGWGDVDERSHGATEGLLVETRTITPIQFSSDTNLAPLMGRWGGQLRFWNWRHCNLGKCPDVPAVGAQTYVVDGLPETVYLGKSAGGQREYGFWFLDFGVPIPVQRVRITTRDRFASDHFVQWLELYGSAKADQFAGVNLTGDAELLFATDRNIDARFELELSGTPMRELAVWVRPAIAKPWEISEIEVYGSGFIPEAQFRTNVLDLDSAVNIGAIEWGGETGLGASVEVRARAGDDDDPNAYYRKTYRGDEEVGFGSDGRTLTRDSYEALELSEQGPIGSDTVNWTSWSGPVDFKAGFGPFLSGPRQFAQLDVSLRSTTYGASRLDYLQFVTSPALATRLVAEIEPGVAVAGTATTFAFRFRPQLEPEDPGFDTIAIDTPAPPLAVEGVAIGGRATDFDLVRLDSTGFAVRLPTHIDVAETMELIEIGFVAEVFEYGAAFESRVFDSAQPDELPQPIIPGDADELTDSNGLQVALADIPDKAIHAFRLAAGAFTPNGDGVNDRLRLEFELLNLRGGGPLTVAFYDLAGRRVGAIDAGQVDNGRSHVDWDGNGVDGLRVPPGVYLVEGTLKTDAGVERVCRAVAVVY